MLQNVTDRRRDRQQYEGDGQICTCPVPYKKFQDMTASVHSIFVHIASVHNHFCTV